MPLTTPPGFKARIRFQFSTEPDDPTPWLRDLRAGPMETKGGSVYSKRELCPNQAQNVYVPAGVDLTVEIHLRKKEQFSPIVLGGIHLAQGEILDLGRVNFGPMIEGTVKVIDSAGKRLEGITVIARTRHNVNWDHGQVSDGWGIVHLRVPPHSEGRFTVSYRDQQTRREVYEGTPFIVGGDEDMGREFILQLSDEMFQLLREERR